MAATEIVVIGGSAGSLQVLMNILGALTADFDLPIIIVIHRQRNVLSGLTNILSLSNKFKKILEPDDKEKIGKCCIYVAPQNYHLLVEDDFSFSLDYSEAIQYSRPSIDVTFESVARIYKDKCLAILLSGANNDGTNGLQSVIACGGIAIIQDPASAEYPAMPQYAIKAIKKALVLKPESISEYLNNLFIENNK